MRSASIPKFKSTYSFPRGGHRAWRWSMRKGRKVSQWHPTTWLLSRQPCKWLWNLDSEAEKNHLQRGLYLPVIGNRASDWLRKEIKK